ncbi:putative photosystem I [Helianthus anomalus]
MTKHTTLLRKTLGWFLDNATDVLEMIPWDGCKAKQIASAPRTEDCVALLTTKDSVAPATNVIGLFAIYAFIFMFDPSIFFLLIDRYLIIIIKTTLTYLCIKTFNIEIKENGQHTYILTYLIITYESCLKPGLKKRALSVKR